MYRKVLGRFGAGVAAAVIVGGVTVGAVTSVAAAPVPGSYQQFKGCDPFLKYVRGYAAPLVGLYGFGGDSPVFSDGMVSAAPPSYTDGSTGAAEMSASSGSSTSTTNTQETGVDEGDTVETDGRYVYTTVGGVLRVVDTTNGKMVWSKPIAVNGSAQLVLLGNRLLVVTGSWDETNVDMYNVTDPTTPKLLSGQKLEGAVVSVRSVMGTARIVMNTNFAQRFTEKFEPSYNTTEEEQKKVIERNRKIVMTAPASDWLPRVYSTTGTGGIGPVKQVLACDKVGRPAEPSGLGLTWVASVDMTPVTDHAVKGSGGIIADTQTVYASKDTLYVASIHQPAPNVRMDTTKLKTRIHAFNIGTTGPVTWLASGTIQGTMLNQFSLSEHDGVLRVAATRYDAGFGRTQTSGIQNMMLDSKNRRNLKVVGEVWGLGNGENVMSVRFLGKQGYVVTFLQTDPLYVVDLTNPKKPVVTGELKIPGYSSYLHPIGDNHLIGVGQNATETGQRLGTQISLFDVSNPAKPVRISNLDVGGNSEAENDHRAFLWWPKTRDVIIPQMVQPWCCDQMAVAPQNPSPSVAVIKIGDRTNPTLTQRGNVTHTARGNDAKQWYAPMSRSLIVSGKLVTVAPTGLAVTDLGSLTTNHYVPFGL